MQETGAYFTPSRKCSWAITFGKSYRKGRVGFILPFVEANVVVMAPASQQGKQRGALTVSLARRWEGNGSRG